MDLYFFQFIGGQGSITKDSFDNHETRKCHWENRVET